MPNHSECPSRSPAVTATQIAEMDRLSYQASPGIWSIWPERIHSREDAVSGMVEQVQKTESLGTHLFLLNAEGKCPAATGCGPFSEANAEFIAALVNGYRSGHLRPAPCDRSPEGGETQRGSTEGESAVPEGQAPNSPTAPQGADLARLLDFGPDLGARTAEPSIRMLARHYYRPHFEGSEVDRLTEAYCSAIQDRIATLVPPTSAPPASAEDQDLIRRACLLHQKWLSAFADDTWTGPEVQHADVTLLLDLATRLDRLSRKAAPPASAAGQEPGLPIDITDALDSFALAVNAMGETVDGRGMPDPDREEIVGQRRAALLAAIRGHIALAHPGSVAPKTLDLIRQARQAASAERALYGDSKGAGDLYDELADALGDALGKRCEFPLERVRHIRSGGIYEVLCTYAQIQTDTPLGDYAKVSVYRDVEPPHLTWVRPVAEMEDGRFEPAPPAASQTEGERPCP